MNKLDFYQLRNKILSKQVKIYNDNSDIMFKLLNIIWPKHTAVIDAKCIKKDYYLHFRGDNFIGFNYNHFKDSTTIIHARDLYDRYLNRPTDIEQFPTLQF